jgi:hypothetical protein
MGRLMGLASLFLDSRLDLVLLAIIGAMVILGAATTD